MSTITEAREAFETLVRMTVGESTELSLEDLDPDIDAIEVDSEALKVFMGTCHCSLASPI